MPRIFLGYDLPERVDDDIALMVGGIPGAHWQTGDQLHLTLHFLGELEPPLLRELVDGLETLELPAFELGLAGAGVFPPRGPAKVVWLGVDDRAGLELAHRRTATVIDRLGIERERRKFAPHVTVARLVRSPDDEVAQWVAGHALYRSERWSVDALVVYSSLRGKGPAKYRKEAIIGSSHS